MSDHDDGADQVGTVRLEGSSSVENALERAGDGWRRLNPRMLVVHPVHELIRLFPVLIGAVIAGTTSGHGQWWSLIGLCVAVVLGVLRWVTTTYRVTPTQVQVRRGFVRRRVLTVPRDRVRTVDVSSALMHRLLGLARVSVGTGVSDKDKSGLQLDALGKREAMGLRDELLHSRAMVGTAPGGVDGRPRVARSLDSTVDAEHTRESTADSAAAATAGVSAGLDAGARDGVADATTSESAAADSDRPVCPSQSSGVAGSAAMQANAASPVAATDTTFVTSVATGGSADAGSVADARRAGHRSEPAPLVGTADHGERPIASFRAAWIRYGPFTLSGIVTIAVLAGVLANGLREANIDPTRLDALQDARHLAEGTSVAVLIAIGLIGIVLLAAIASTVGYVLAFWAFRLTRQAGTLHISRGLLSTRSITIEERRMRGVEISQPLLLRAVGGGRCIAITTGLRVGGGAERGGSLLLPPAPYDEAERVAVDVLGDRAPVVVPLAGHGPMAQRRRFTRALGVGAVLALVLVAFGIWRSFPVGIDVAMAAVVVAASQGLAYDRAGSLGHALVDGWLVSRFGSVVRRRCVLTTEGIIGWNMHRSFFQRRLGLTTLVATTAAGHQEYKVLDIPDHEAVRLADSAVPGLLTPFLESVDGHGDGPATEAESPAGGAPGVQGTMTP